MKVSRNAYKGGHRAMLRALAREVRAELAEMQRLRDVVRG